MTLILLATSHRVAPGLLTWRAWQVLHEADRVLVGSDGHPQLPYLLDAGVPVEVTAAEPAALLAAATGGPVVWVGSPEGDEDLLRAVATRAVNAPESPEIEVLHGSYDLPGARLLDLVQVMDTLRRDCPWDREQTHATLARYLLEEAYETVQAIEDGDMAELREELGDVLMQVAFHSAVAAERGEFTVDDVAEGIVAKLVRRHPHVFAGLAVSGTDEVAANWEQIKAAERTGKQDESAFASVALGQPALALAAKAQRRADRLDAPADLDAAAGAGLGARLFALVREGQAAGLDPEAELRAAARAYLTAARAWEAQQN